MRTFRKLVTVAVGAAVIAGSSLLAAPQATAEPAPPGSTPRPRADFDPKAASNPKEAVGHRTSPGQPYHQNPDPEYDWLGSYLVRGEKVWCVQFALTAPNTDEEYRPGDPLKTKWGQPLTPGIAANISYLLLRYGDTEKPDEAAALAHLLHSWTAGPRTPSDLDPSNGFETIGYAIDAHFDKLPQGAKKMVRTMREEAEANRGPWQAELTAPEEQQIIGRSAEWTLEVTRARGDGGVGDVPVKLDVQDAKVEGLGEDGIVRTPEDGGPLKLQVTPTGPNPKINGTLSAPADRPFVRDAVNAPNTTQRVVSTGGEKQLSVQAAARAVTAPGAVQLRKIDERSEAGIAGVALRLTAGDESSPATKQDGSPLVGPDGAPPVLTTRKDGSLAVQDLKTPQRVCLVETSPAPGYEDAFDKANPPSACGKLEPGKTLTLQLANAKNTPSVPVTIPAGDGSTAVGPDSGQSRDGLSAGLLGGLMLAGAGLGAGVALRRRVAQR